MNKLLVNDVIESHMGSAAIRYRIIDMLAAGRVILFRLPPSSVHTDFPPVRLTMTSTKDLHGLLSDGVARQLKEDPYVPPLKIPASTSNNGNVSISQDEVRRDTAFQIISWVISGGFQPLLTKNGRAKRFAEASEKFGVQSRKVNRWLGRFLAFGMVPNSLYALHQNKGGRGKPKSIGDAKRGRKPTFQVSGGCNVTPEIRKAIQVHAKALLKKGMITERDRWDNFCKTHYADGREIDPQGVEITRILPQSCKITFSTYSKYYHKDRHPTEHSKLIHGPRHELNHRDRVGSETARTLFAGELLQIDFTIADIELVHPIYRTKLPIGRPLTGLGCDVFSTYHAGMLVPMANASSLQAMLLLENILSDKVEFCRKLGIKIESEDWLGGFLWREVFADNGELRGLAAQLIVDNLGMAFTHAPPYRADQKGTIESAISVLTGRHIALLPGYKPRFRERGDKRGELDAQLDPQAFARIVAKACIQRNKAWIDRHYLTLQAETDGIHPRPYDIFLHSITNSGALRRAPSSDILRFLLLHRDTAQIDGDGKGIVYKGLYYENSDLQREGAFVKARESGRKPIIIAKDPRLVDAIYFIPNPNEKRMIPCPLGPRSRKYTGRFLSFEDVAALQGNHKFERASSSDADQQQRIDFKGEINEILEEQKDRNNAAKGTERSFAPVTKRQARKAAGRDCDRADARVLHSPEAADKKIVPFPNGGKSAPTDSVTPPQPEPSAKDARDHLLKELLGAS